MAKQCSLCNGELSREENVCVSTVQLVYSLAWVCTDCSAAFPIAISSFGMFKKPKPMYEDGKKA